MKEEINLVKPGVMLFNTRDALAGAYNLGVIDCMQACFKTEEDTGVGCCSGAQERMIDAVTSRLSELLIPGEEIGENPDE